MKTGIITVAALMVSASLAMAQTTGGNSGSSTSSPAGTTGAAPTTQPAPDRASSPGSSTSAENDKTPPLKGANSFTEGEAKKRAESRGFNDITDLKKDKDGIWRGRATHDGKTVEIAVDYKGNVVPTSQQ